jgi:glycosyltransferase involved in cell wall biosynthesis
MRILFALPGLHRHDRGAEVAFITLAEELSRLGERVTLIGSGGQRGSTQYRFVSAGSLAREHFESFPSVPFLRDDCAYEELTFVPGLLRNYRPREFDVTVTCGYPFVNLTLRRPTLGKNRPPHVFVTQNGDWPAYANNAEYRFFGCEGLVCTNPDFYDRNKHRWQAELIPNGVDCERFRPGVSQRAEFGLPEDQLVVLMVSALISSKRVAAGIEAVSELPDCHLVVAGDGPLRAEIDTLGATLLPGRFTRLSVPPQKMPSLYRSADVFLHLSKIEPFGNVFLEAMACGLPIVGVDSPRLRWIVGENEFLVQSNSPADTAKKIEQAGTALSSTHREDRLRKASAFSWKEIAARYRDFLQVVIREHGKSRMIRTTPGP